MMLFLMNNEKTAKIMHKIVVGIFIFSMVISLILIYFKYFK